MPNTHLCNQSFHSPSQGRGSGTPASLISQVGFSPHIPGSTQGHRTRQEDNNHHNPHSPCTEQTPGEQQQSFPTAFSSPCSEQHYTQVWDAEAFPLPPHLGVNGETSHLPSPTGGREHPIRALRFPSTQCMASCMSLNRRTVWVGRDP